MRGNKYAGLKGRLSMNIRSNRTKSVMQVHVHVLYQIPSWQNYKRKINALYSRPRMLIEAKRASVKKRSRVEERLAVIRRTSIRGYIVT